MMEAKEENKEETVAFRSVIRTKDRSGYDAVLSGDLQRRGCH